MAGRIHEDRVDRFGLEVGGGGVSWRLWLLLGQRPSLTGVDQLTVAEGAL
jgi:hypothetical protein